MVSILGRDFNFSDILRPHNVDEFCLQPTPANTNDDIYLDRIDVAGIKERPLFLFPFITKLEIEHPKKNQETDTTTVIVLDLDEVAAVAAGSESGGSVIAESFLLGGAGLLALWFGTKASIEKINETTNDLHELKAEKQELKEALRNIRHEEISPEALQNFAQNIKVIRLENKSERRYLKSDRIFSGVFSGVGATGVAAGTFLEVPLYATEASAAAGSVVLSAAAPVVSVFALGVAAQQAHRFYKAHAISQKVEFQIQASRNSIQRDVYNLLRERIDLTRKVSSARSVSMTCLAVGAPLTVFGGPYGLAVLLPGVVGSIISSYIDTRKIGYIPQLSWQEKAHLNGKDGIINEIYTAHQEYTLLKSLKNEQRLRYPIGSDAPRPFRWLAKGSAFIRRKLEDNYIEAAPENTFFRFLQKHTELKVASIKRGLSQIENELSKLRPEEILRKNELVEKKTKSLTELSELTLENEIMERELTKEVTQDQSMFYILQYLVKNHLFAKYSELLLKDRKIKKALSQEGVITKTLNEFHVDANKLVLLLTKNKDKSLLDKKLTKKLFTKGRDVLLSKAKDNARFRERQLLDFLAAHLAAEDEPAKKRLSFVERLKLSISNSGI